MRKKLFMVRLKAVAVLLSILCVFPVFNHTSQAAKVDPITTVQRMDEKENSKSISGSSFKEVRKRLVTFFNKHKISSIITVSVVLVVLTLALVASVKNRVNYENHVQDNEEHPETALKGDNDPSLKSPLRYFLCRFFRFFRRSR